MNAVIPETVRNDSGIGQSRRNRMAVLRFSPKLPQIVQRKESILL
jgi:hypothetical protein